MCIQPSKGLKNEKEGKQKTKTIESPATNRIKRLPIKSSGRVPKYSPRIVIFVPGGPSFGDKPVTTGFGAISQQNDEKITDNSPKITENDRKC